MDVTMPQLGETVTEGTITKWFKAVGDKVDADEPLFEVSTDKVDSEVPAPQAGYITEIVVPEGETVAVGARLAVIGDQAGAAAPSPTTASTTPTSTVSPSGTLISVRVPLTGEGTSESTLSVDTSKSGSSSATVSPTALNHFVIVPSVTVSPSWGIWMSAMGGRLLEVSRGGRDR